LLRGIIFDLGNTLIHFTGDWNAVLEESWQVLAEYLIDQGFDFEKDVFINTFRELFESRYYERSVDHIEQPTTELLCQVMLQLGYEKLEKVELEKAMDEFYRVSEAHWSTRAVVSSTLDDLKSKGLRMALISNAGDASNVKRLLDKGQLMGYFDPILVSADEGIRKPHVSLYHKVLREWGLKAEEVVMIGDSLMEDILGAQRSGVHHIWMKEHVDTAQNHDLSMQIRPEAVAKTFQEIPGIIHEMNEEA
jgi:HAD superfamily hydrolase (TIGR01549 family)